MYSIYSSSSVKTYDFPKIFKEDQKIFAKLKTIIKILKDQFLSLCHKGEKASNLSPVLFKKLILNRYSKEKFIKKLATCAFFIQQEITYEKICSGHEFYITHRLKSHKEIKNTIREYSNWITNQPGVIAKKTYGWEEKEKDNSYLAKFKVYHENNCPSCQSESKIIVSSQKISCALDELTELEALLESTQYSYSAIYDNIFEKVTEFEK